MVDSIIERMWDNIRLAASKRKPGGGWYVAAQILGPCRRLVHCRTIAGVGRRYARHPVQGRSLGRAVRGGHREGLFQEGRRRHHRRHFRRRRRRLGARGDRERARLRRDFSGRGDRRDRPGPGHQDRRYRLALARRQRHHRDAEFADQVDQGSQGQEIRHQQSQIARRDDHRAGAEKAGLNPKDIQRVALGNLPGAADGARNRRRRCHRDSRHVVPDVRRRQQIPRHHGAEGDAAIAARRRHRHRRPDARTIPTNCGRFSPAGAKA